MNAVVIIDMLNLIFFNKIPIVGSTGSNWQDEVLSKLKSDLDEKNVLPFYGSEPHITKSKK